MEAKSPWASGLIAAVCLYCLCNVGCSGLFSHSTTTTPPNGSPGNASISGVITPAEKAGNIRITLTGLASETTETDSSGNYSFSALPVGTYTLTPSKSGMTFTPATRSVKTGASEVTGADFAANDPVTTATISGTISPAAQASGVTVTLKGESNATTTTDSSGNFIFSGLDDGSYTLTPSKPGYSFSPASRNVTADGSDISSANFTARVPLKASGPIVINGQNGTVIDGLKITSSTGDCVRVTNSNNVTIQNSEIGPCGGNGIKISGGNGIGVFDNYIHPETLASACCDHNDGIYATDAPHNLSIQGNVIAYGESNIEVQGGSSVSVVGNFLLNPRGPFPRGNNFQCWNSCTAVTVQNNYALSSTDTSQYLYPEGTQDSISFGASYGFLVQNNFVTGGHSSAGCGIMADTRTDRGQIMQNRLLDTGQCGIGMVDGSHNASNNFVLNRVPVNGSGNTAMYVAHYGQGSTCGPMTVANNIADQLQPSGYHSGFWDKGDCQTVTTTTDTFGQSADGPLSPVSSVFRPPLIPPQPKNCVAPSPYSTQTSSATCVP